MAVRVRIAPSPTGAPHVGTAYIALFNMAFARRHGGQFILRIEDTDSQRCRPRYETDIMEALRWLGIVWDEGPDVGGPVGPYRQSERSAIYQDHARILLDNGSAYRCFCTPERLDRLRETQKAQKLSALGYDRACRDLPQGDSEDRAKRGEPHVVRLRMPLQGTTVVPDLLRASSPPSFDNSQIDDQVLLKSDGLPTYHLAAVVDDHLMGITHVIRAEEWLSSTPKHLQLYQSFGWTPPAFCHLPLLRNNDRSKISKRKNPTSLTFYRRMGYLPEAILNFLALMGWAMPEERELFTLEEFIESFELERVSLGGPVFSMDKLRWLNGRYIREVLSREELLERLQASPLLSTEYLRTLMPMVYERIDTLSDFFKIGDLFLVGSLEIDPALLLAKGRSKGDIEKLLRSLLKLLSDPEPWEAVAIEKIVRPEAEALGWLAGDAFMVLRICMSGRRESPPLFDMMEALGKDVVLDRLRGALGALVKAGR